MNSIKPYIAITLPIVVILVFVFAFNESSKEEEEFEFNYQGGQPQTTTDTQNMDILPPQENNSESTYNSNVNIDNTKKQYVILDTSEGKIKIELAFNSTPKTASNFWELSEKGFYNNTIFHRAIDGFMVQGGDPKGDGTGGPGYKFDDEPFTGEYTRGTVAMANSGPNTNGSQFFIMHQDNPLPKNYVIFGKVTEGLEVVDKIATAPVTANAFGEPSKPFNPVKVLTATTVEE
jgi:cyclophilin family peptidyl-prolyl cis-trans isomerase